MSVNSSFKLSNVVFSHFLLGCSDDRATAVSLTLEFNRTQNLWESILTFQLAMENGALLGSPGMFDEASCRNTDDSHCEYALCTGGSAGS